jgi:HD superfamily phosphohydrolase
MPKTWPKVILDPVHNLTSFEDNPTDRLLLDLINTQEFQRLRRIKQLGMSELVFPGSNHSRFAHSIGVMHVARLMVQRTEAALQQKLPDDAKMSVCAAALLHDVGHGPFSHAFEKVTKERHEARGLEIIRSEATNVNRILKGIDSNLPDRIALFIEPASKETWQAAGIPLYLRSVVSSQLDADRLDYLLRDSFATGTTYGRFDLNWLLLHLRVDLARERICLGRKARSVVETYVFARHHMYKSVYFHKTTRAAEVMLRLVFRRYAELLRGADGEEAKRAIVPGAPGIVVDAFSKQLTLSSYLELDDYVVGEFLKRCEEAKDSVLRTLGGGIAHRRLYKAVDVTSLKGDALITFAERAKARAREVGLDPDYHVVADSAADTSYKPYNPAKDSEPTQIFIEDERGEITELSTISQPVNELRHEMSWLRYYVPETLRNDTEAICSEIVKGA